MAAAVEEAVATYVAVFSEPDPAIRATLIDACFAEHGRFVTRSRETRGRAAIADMATRLFADPDVARVRVVALDARGTTFRFRSVVEHRDGTTSEFFDAGEIDAEGRIVLILTFAGAF
jgi:hypothetical protein